MPPFAKRSDTFVISPVCVCIAQKPHPVGSKNISTSLTSIISSIVIIIGWFSSYVCVFVWRSCMYAHTQVHTQQFIAIFRAIFPLSVAAKFCLSVATLATRTEYSGADYYSLWLSGRDDCVARRSVKMVHTRKLSYLCVYCSHFIRPGVQGNCDLRPTTRRCI